MASDKELLKEQARKRAQGYRSGEIKVIEAKKPINIRDTNETLRVCAYCRVSTDNVEQTSSYELQRAYYEEYIKEHENWVMVDIYADEGISGTSMKHRTDFNRMIADCRLGKIDLIVTKSISRFARNIVDCIDTIRQLRSLPKPVRVFFETENIDTADSQSDVMLNLLAIFAEEESRTKSEIMNWSIDNRMNRGNFLTPELFGYVIDKDKPDRYIIVEDEAEIVKLVYSMYVTGYSPKEIADIMIQLGYKSNKKGECKWNSNVVRNIIDNERRCGKIIGRKTYTPNFLDHKSRKNNFNRNQYYLPDHHIGIITPDMYEYAIRLKQLYKYHRFNHEIPALSVVREGALKGFVPVCRNYPGFVYENYLFASDFAYEFDKKGVVKDGKKELQKHHISDFDLSGYEVADAQFFSDVEQPTCWFTRRQMYFNKACINKMMASEFIELLFEPYEKLIAIRSCEPTHPNAIKWFASKDGKVSASTRACSGFAEILFRCMEWNNDYRYKMVGVKRAKGDDVIVLFDLNAAEPLTREKYIDEEDKERSVIVQLFDPYFVSHFGKEIYENAYAMRLYLMDVFKTWNLDAEVVPIGDEVEWLTEAKQLVNQHIEKLKERKLNEES